MAIFKSYYVFPVKEKLIKLKQDFISSKDSYNLCTVTSKKSDWFDFKNGVYYIKSDDNFDINLIPDKIMALFFVNEFIRKGLSSKYQLNAVKYKDMYCYILSWMGISNYNDGFSLEHAALVSEDIYNIYMILARKFLSTTTPEDLSQYRDFFTVFEVPGQVINTNSIEQEYKSGIISLDDMEEKIYLLEKENQAILSLHR